MYYWMLLELIDDLEGDEIFGSDLHRLFSERHGRTGHINLNKALRKLRVTQKIGYRKANRGYYYYSIKTTS